MHEPEELELINELRKTEDIHNLTQMLRSGDMKGFYKTAERVLRVKPANPVVMKITTDNDEVIDDKNDVDRHIKQYFKPYTRRQTNGPTEWSSVRALMTTVNAQTSAHMTLNKQ